jgi:hypothetical protein
LYLKKKKRISTIKLDYGNGSPFTVEVFRYGDPVFICSKLYMSEFMNTKENSPEYMHAQIYVMHKNGIRA